MREREGEKRRNESSGLRVGPFLLWKLDLWQSCSKCTLKQSDFISTQTVLTSLQAQFPIHSYICTQNCTPSRLKRVHVVLYASLCQILVHVSNTFIALLQFNMNTFCLQFYTYSNQSHSQHCSVGAKCGNVGNRLDLSLKKHS